MNKANLKRLSVILVFGSIWGIVEASLGYALHFLPALIAGGVMFPIVVFLLLRARLAGAKKIDIVLIGIVAALIKSVNLLMPAINVFKTINPMIAIIMESLVVFAVIPLVDKGILSAKISGLLLASVAWRGLYLLYMGGQYLATGFIAAQLSSFAAGYEFMIIGGLLSGSIVILAYALHMALRNMNLTHVTTKLWIGIPAFGVAVFLTILL